MLEAPWSSGGDHCGKEAGETAERGAEEVVVTSFALKDSNEPPGLLAEL